MRKSILLLSLSFLLGLTSCFKEENDVFDESSALRLNHTIESYQELLTSAENGWVLQYFATENGIAGVPMLVDFQKTGAVVVGAQNKIATNDTYKEETSAFDIIGDYGPVLTFNTYNTLLHVYSNPEDLPSTSDEDEQGVGYGGDYEFRIVSVSEDQNTVYMKGKKTDMDVVLTRLSTDLAWSNYFTRLEEVRNESISPKIKALFLNAGGEEYLVTGISTGILSFVPKGGDAITQTIKVSSITHIDGSVHLAVPFKGEDDNFSVQNFVKQEDGIFHCTDSEDAYLSAGTAYDQLSQNGYVWKIVESSISADLLPLYQAVGKDITALAGDAFSSLYMVYDAKDGKIAFQFRTLRGVKLNIAVDRVVEDDAIKYVYDPSFKQTSTDGQNGAVLMENSEACRTFIAALTGQSFTVAGNDPVNMLQYAFTGKSDAKTTFTFEIQ